MRRTREISLASIIMTLGLIIGAYLAFPRQSGSIPLEPGGTIYLSDGSAVRVEKFTKVLVQDEIIYGEREDKEEELRISSISRIKLLTDGVDYVFDNSKFTKKSGTMEIVLKNGKTLVLNNAYFPEKTFTITVRDPKKGNLVEKELPFRSVKEISFEKGPAIYKRCPSDGRIFPSDYLYCPFDKTLLEKVIAGPE